MGSLTRPVTSCTQNRGIFKLAHALCGEAALGFPRGEAAERSEADEGWRELKPSTAIRCFVETQANATHRTAFINLPVATPHQPALPVPKCRQVRQLPPGGSQELKRFWQLPFNEPLTSVSLRAAAPLGSTASRPLQGAGETIGLQQPTGYTPSASRSLSSSLREGAKGASHQETAGGISASPTVGDTRPEAHTNQHSTLPQLCAVQISQTRRSGWKQEQKSFL